VHFPEHYPLISFLVYTGVRFSEAAALRWDDIDEGRGII
jgi:integrase